MSVTVHVEHHHPLSVQEFSERIRTALSDILGTDPPSSIGISTIELAEAGDSAVPILTNGALTAICEVTGRPEQVSIRAVMLPIEVPSSNERLKFSEAPFLSLELHGSSRTPLSWALLAAIAISVADVHGGTIFDDAGILTRDNEVTSVQLSSALRSAARFDNLDSAAAALYEKMNKSSEIDAFVRSMLNQS